MTEDEMAGWHHRLDGHELEQTPGVGDGQGGLACCDSWGHKELDTAEQLNLNLNLSLSHLNRAHLQINLKNITQRQRHTKTYLDRHKAISRFIF